MGGMGSGRHWYCGAKDTTSDYLSIDVRRWKRDGLLAPHKSFAWQWSRSGGMSTSIEVRTEPDRVFLTYRHRNGTDDWRKENYPIYLDWTECNLGGERPWFICPAHSCGRRVAILYGGGIFACRHCHQLAYPSQREVAYDRAARRADKIRARLGWKQGVLNPKGWKKPKGMHWSTFERLNKEHDAFVQFSLEGIANLLNVSDY
ncbi:MAG: hypothetical protein ABW124_05405 [Candidatus Thiodiazotropha sp. 6PLUC9]